MTYNPSIYTDENERRAYAMAYARGLQGVPVEPYDVTAGAWPNAVGRGYNEGAWDALNGSLASVLCKIGWHKWVDHDDAFPGDYWWAHDMCCRCGKMRRENRT